MDLAKKVLQLTRSNSRIIFQPLPADDPKQRNPDLSLAEHALHFMSPVDLDEGLARTIKYFHMQLSLQRTPPFHQRGPPLHC